MQNVFNKIKLYILSVIKQPLIFCSFVFAFCVCYYLKNFSSSIFITAFICAFLGSLITISVYDTAFKENLGNRIFQKYNIKDIKRIIKECDIEINKDFMGFYHYLTEQDKEKILTILEDTESIFKKKEA